MPGWLIDLFGSREVNDAFWMLTLAPLPVWVAWVFFPEGRFAHKISSPFLFPFLLALGYLFFVWKAFDVGYPAHPDAHHKAVRGYIRHPMIFLVLWSHLQMANLFVAAVLLHFARKEKMQIPVEVALCWLFAPVGVVIFTVRRALKKFFTVPEKPTKKKKK